MDDSVELAVKYGELWQKEIELQNRLEKLEKQLMMDLIVVGWVMK